MSDKQYNYNVRYAIVYEHWFNLYTLIITKKKWPAWTSRNSYSFL